MAPTRSIDDGEATRLLAEGNTVLQVARTLHVSPQALYLAIKAGRVTRPAAETAEAVA